ncbi:hypothetical protein cyc_03420 [Cyclospora cayetanensis]|uniref:START domain-containing protein n=1 Tax=Cyclospora cayetanensis TaxID=88456 RepID=A0A1D3CWC4_9EIME|nr:hypothetical protein cyc_03420 [Cyclospora cayetanensis]
MTGRENGEKTFQGCPQGEKCPDDSLEMFLMEKEIHNHLCSLERHLDAFLVLKRLQGRLKKLLGGAGGEDHVSGGENDSRLVAESVKEMTENDPEFVETAFRRLMVAEVYRDLGKEDCRERLDLAAPLTDKLIQQLREEKAQMGNRNPLSGIENATKGKKHALKAKENSSEPSLLNRVLAQTAHPLLASERPGTWKEVINDGQQLRIALRNYDDNPEKLSFKIEGIVAAPLLCILSVLNEVDHFINWVPYFTRPFKLGLRKVDNQRLGRVDQMVHLHIDFPWPFTSRDACFEVFAVDDFERNSQIVVKMITLDQKYKTPRQNMDIPAPARRVERIIVDGSLVIRPIGRDSSLLSLLWHENCRMRVPIFMADFVAKQATSRATENTVLNHESKLELFARKAFDAFRRTCEGARAGVLQQRRKQNTSLYGFIADRLAQVGLGNTFTRYIGNSLLSEKREELHVNEQSKGRDQPEEDSEFFDVDDEGQDNS